MQTLPLYIYLVFGLTVVAAIGLFYKATGNSRPFLILISLWVIFQSWLGVRGFYEVGNTTPPRFIFLVVPPTIVVLMSLFMASGKNFIDRMNLKTLTILHTIRIPVEFAIYVLFLNKAVPAVMTFEGRNFDIFSGITAPLIWYFGFVKPRLNKTVIIIWNLVCLGLLLNIIAITIVTVTTKTGPVTSGQPPLAFAYFPFLLLPSCIVPLVMYAHLAGIRQLMKTKIGIITQ